jgi:hypothetical protein
MYTRRDLSARLRANGLEVPEHAIWASALSLASQGVGRFSAGVLELLLRQLRDAVALVDPSGRILLTNRADELRIPPPVRTVRTGESTLDEEFQIATF